MAYNDISTLKDVLNINYKIYIITLSLKENRKNSLTGKIVEDCWKYFSLLLCNFIEITLQ